MTLRLSGTYSTADQSCPCSAQLFVGLTLSSRQCSPCSQITTQVTVTHFMKNKEEKLLEGIRISREEYPRR